MQRSIPRMQDPLRRTRRAILAGSLLSAMVAAGIPLPAAAKSASPARLLRCDPVPGLPPLRLELVASGLARPLHLTAPPGDETRLFVVEKAGTVRIVRDGSVLPTPFLDLSSLVLSTGNEQGLLSLAFHPQYASNGKFYVDYTAPLGGPAGQTVVQEFLVSAGNPDLADLASGRILFTTPQPFATNNGGQLAFGLDGYLYISLGDGGSANDPSNNAQNLNSYLGKILRIDVDSPTTPYGIPPTNPFALGGGLPEIWSFGLRNPWRFSFDRMTGDLYIGDVGQGCFEEIHVAPPSPGGENYGWKPLEGIHCRDGNCASTQSCGPGCAAAPSCAPFTLPVIEYPHTTGSSVIGGFVYRGCRLPGYDGTYFYADYVTDRVFSFVYSGGAATNLQEWTAALGGPVDVTSFGEDANGELYFCLEDGSIHRLSTSAPAYSAACATTDSCAFVGAGGDGNVDPGESVSVALTLTNTSTSAATSVTATVTSPTSGVTVTQGFASFGSIPPGGSAPGDQAIAYNVADTVPCGTQIDLTIAVSSVEGPAATGCSVQVPASCTVCAPAGPVTFAIEGCASTSSCALGGGGSGNGRVDPGETVQTTPTLRNTSATSATNVRAVVTSPTPGVTITQDQVVFGDLPAGQAAIGSPPVAYLVDAAFPCSAGGSIALDFTITSLEGPGLAGCNVPVASPCDRCLPTPCNLTVPTCSVNPCLGGCPGDVTVRHELQAPCAGGGSLYLLGTRYETTCHNGSNGCAVDVPPLRLWAYDSYEGANSGCEPPELYNSGLDFPNPVVGHWVVTASWRRPLFDGCIEAAPVRRLVAELSFEEGEGSVDHGSRFLLASVPEARPGAYDLDVLQGSTSACGTADIGAFPVPPPTVPGKPGGCTGSNEVLEATPNAIDGRFMDVPIAVSPPSPTWYSESGVNGGPPLVAGYQLLYSIGTREPTTSVYDARIWLPVYDPASPALRLGVAPLGPGSTTVTLPVGAAGDRAWLATRVVYQDQSMNPAGAFDVALPGPLVVSEVSGHCGPLARPRLADSNARYGQTSVPPGSLVTLFVELQNTGDRSLFGLTLNPDATLVTATIRFDPCVDTSLFDPATDVNATVLPFDPPIWTPATQTLVINFTGTLPPGPPFPVVTITGIQAGPSSTPACCTVASISHGNNPNFLPVPACFTITNCPAMPMTGLTVAKRAGGAAQLSWDPVDPSAAVSVNIWKLLGPAPLIPSASAANAPVTATSVLRRACQTGATATSCVDAETIPAALAFYQARAVCLDGTESP